MNQKQDEKENKETRQAGLGRTYKLDLTEKVPIKEQKVSLGRTYKLDILEKVPIKDTTYRFNIALSKSVAETLKHFSDSGVLSLGFKEAQEAVTRLQPIIESATKALQPHLGEIQKLATSPFFREFAETQKRLKEQSERIASALNSLPVLSIPSEQNQKFTLAIPPRQPQIVVERIDKETVKEMAKEIIACFLGEIKQTLSIPATNKLADIDKMIEEKVSERLPSRNYLKSIHLLTHSLEPSSVIFLVLDERFEIPIRCTVKNKRGEPAYIKKLYDIAYFVDAPNKKVSYNKILADNINNGLFRKRPIAKYMKTNKLKKPTLVKKSEEDKLLVLKNEVPVKTGLIKHSVPLQHQSLYIDKTK